jgi:phospholipase B1
MDELAEAYDKAVIELIREWDEEDDETFAAIWCVTRKL